MAGPDNSEQKEYKSIKLFLANTRSAKGKCAELTALTHEYDLICLTETHVDNTISNCNIIDSSNLDFFRHDRNLYGGGVLIATNKSLKATAININLYNEEMKLIKIPPRLVVCCYYRPYVHLSNIDTLNKILSDVHNKFPNHQILFVGDMNLPGVDWQNVRVKTDSQHKHIHQQFVNMLNENSLQQLIKLPTHRLGNTLDLVCTNDTSIVTSTDVVIPGVSDHYIVTANVQIKTSCHITHAPGPEIVIRLFREADVNSFYEYMRPVEESLSKMDDVEEMWNVFSTSFRNAVKHTVPTKTFKKTLDSKPKWLNKHAEKLLRKQRKVRNRYKSSGDVFDLTYYNQLRRDNKKVFKNLKRKHLVEKICKPLEKGDCKPFYRFVRQSQSDSKPQLLSLKLPNGKQTSNKQECADTLNYYFSSQFCTGEGITDLPTLSVSQSNIEITTEGVKKLIVSLKNNKSPGPDQIRKCEMLIEPNLTALCLTHIFQASITSGKLPTAWKLAHVTPIHKKGPTDESHNYRPISLTSIPCKMLEHIVLHYLNATLDKVLHSRQHGFRSGLSCETQLCSTFHDLAKTAENSLCTHALALDFKKAFDKVPHRLLMNKIR